MFKQSIVIGTMRKQHGASVVKGHLMTDSCLASDAPSLPYYLSRHQRSVCKFYLTAMVMTLRLPAVTASTM